ncbi:syntaxin-21-like isoform X1 [Salvia miltiorrhiza]|uniref:syntaxin-21-like isoform X1 n=1 Tax=Salvia miltiorrhiza TaxID=226208 RepID=UPI0025AD7F47|nr:syntaxin-21-like isoform X1 [Salvia miltiorrhiza]
MSFEDLESGRALIPLAGPRHIEQGPSRALAAGVFRINTAVAGYKRLVNCIGTPRDAVDLRHNLRKTRLQIRQLVKETSAELDRVRETYKFSEVNDSKKIADAKLTKDYESVLKDFEKAQLLAADKEKAFPHPIANNARQPSNRASELEISSLNPMQASLVREANRHVMHMENEIVLNEAIIEEREQGIREIQKEIGEVNDIFKDLAQLVSAQGSLIGDISSNIESSHASTGEAANQLTKASNTQRSTSSMTCLMLVIVGIILLIVVVVVLS